jgi:hypothetical protein
MYEVSNTLTDDYGTRVVATGFGSINYSTAEKQLLQLTAKYPGQSFFIEYIPSEDEFNAY